MVNPKGGQATSRVNLPLNGTRFKELLGWIMAVAAVRIGEPEQVLSHLTGSKHSRLQGAVSMSEQSTLFDHLQQGEVEYRDVPSPPGYRVGDDGSVWGRQVNTRGATETEGEWYRIVGGSDKDGYRKVILCHKGKRRYVRVNVLILETFVGPKPCPDAVAAHENGIRDDNRLCNLRWDVQVNNIADKRRHGTHQHGERHGCARLDEEEVRSIRKRYAAGGVRQCDLAAEHKVSVPTISAIITRRLWSHVSDD